MSTYEAYCTPKEDDDLAFFKSVGGDNDFRSAMCTQITAAKVLGGLSLAFMTFTMVVFLVQASVQVREETEVRLAFACVLFALLSVGCTAGMFGSMYMSPLFGGLHAWYISQDNDVPFTSSW